MLTRIQLDAWLAALRANPEKQLQGQLFSNDLTKTCCLGELCLVTNQPIEKLKDRITGLMEFHCYNDLSVLNGPLMVQFGDDNGDFDRLRMPYLHSCGCATAANDKGVSWLEIADHFEKYYQPCESFD